MSEPDKTSFTVELTFSEAVRLLATDQQTSVTHCLSGGRTGRQSYSPFGQHSAKRGALSLLGFNGERIESMTGHYFLGQGYRQFNPALMRFNRPDSLSPFGRGGINCYAYCGGDPLNRKDPSGHTWKPLKRFLRRIGLMDTPTRKAPPHRVQAMGFHGTTRIDADNLVANGPQKMYEGKSSGFKNLKHGGGFYVAQNIEEARIYATDHLYDPRNPEGIAAVVKVYVENFKYQRPGKHYLMVDGSHGDVLVFQSSAYRDIYVEHHEIMTQHGITPVSTPSQANKVIRNIAEQQRRGP